MIMKRLIFLTMVVIFISNVNAFGGEAIITGQYKGFTLIKTDWQTLQEIMEEKGFSHDVNWSAFTDFRKRQIWYTEDFVERFLDVGDSQTHMMQITQLPAGRRCFHRHTIARQMGWMHGEVRSR